MTMQFQPSLHYASSRRDTIMHLVGVLAISLSMSAIVAEITPDRAWAAGVFVAGLVVTYISSRRAGKKGAEQTIGEAKQKTDNNTQDISWLTARIVSLEKANGELMKTNEELRTTIAKMQLGGPKDD